MRLLAMFVAHALFVVVFDSLPASNLARRRIVRSCQNFALRQMFESDLPTASSRKNEKIQPLT